MQKWFMLTLVGKDRAGIVAKVTEALYRGGCNLGEASMLRLGGNFTIMLMAYSALDQAELEHLLQPVAQDLGLRVHVDSCEDELYRQAVPDVRITVHGADRAGIVAQVTAVLAGAGLNIVDLESDVGGGAEQPFYLMHIEGVATQGIAALQAALDTLAHSEQGRGIEARLTPIDTEVF